MDQCFDVGTNESFDFSAIPKTELHLNQEKIPISIFHRALLIFCLIIACGAAIFGFIAVSNIANLLNTGTVRHGPIIPPLSTTIHTYVEQHNYYTLHYPAGWTIFATKTPSTSNSITEFIPEIADGNSIFTIATNTNGYSSSMLSKLLSSLHCAQQYPVLFTASQTTNSIEWHIANSVCLANNHAPMGIATLSTTYHQRFYLVLEIAPNATFTLTQQDEFDPMFNSLLLR